ncbi:MAG: hypothetical protein ACT4RN_20290 [Pseudonocardia sp.]
MATSARSALAALCCAVTLVAVAACGAPEYTYVTNSDQRTYVKIPSTWRPVDPRQLDAAFGLDPATEAAAAGIWHEAYDAAPVPATEHLIGWSATAPVALVGVRQIPAGQRGQYSLDGLRDLFLPVSATSRRQLPTGPAAGGGLTDFALYTDEVLTPGSGVRGVHSVFRYRMGLSPPQTINQTVYLNDDASTIYMFFVRCSTTCYADRQEEIENVVSSFTVRGAP